MLARLLALLAALFAVAAGTYLLVISAPWVTYANAANFIIIGGVLIIVGVGATIVIALRKL